MRIPHAQLVDHVTTSILDTKSRLAEMQIGIATGQNYIRRSDDTSSSIQATRLEEEQSDNNQWEKNIDHATFWTRATDAKISNVNDIMQRITEVATAASNGTHPESYRQDLAVEVNNALEDLLDLANSSIDGVPLFAGTATDQAPFTATRDAVTNNITSILYNGNSIARQVQIGDSTNASYSTTGGGTNGLFASTKNNADPTDDVDIFASLVSLRDELITGTVPSDTVHQGVERAADHVISKVVDNGLKQSRFETLSSKMVDLEMVNRNRISELKDIDLAKAATELAQLQASYQASLQIASRIGQLNLMNYL